jgi:hypothetical protein
MVNPWFVPDHVTDPDKWLDQQQTRSPLNTIFPDFIGWHQLTSDALTHIQPGSPVHPTNFQNHGVAGRFPAARLYKHMSLWAATFIVARAAIAKRLIAKIDVQSAY